MFETSLFLCLQKWYRRLTLWMTAGLWRFINSTLTLFIVQFLTVAKFKKSLKSWIFGRMRSLLITSKCISLFAKRIIERSKIRQIFVSKKLNVNLHWWVLNITCTRSKYTLLSWPDGSWIYSRYTGQIDGQGLHSISHTFLLKIYKLDWFVLTNTQY